MKDTDKTTVYLGGDDYRRLKGLGRKRGVPAAELVREAVAEYVVRHAPQRQPRSFGKFSSGRTDLSERAEALLAGMGRAR
ncbi:MAG: CopG family transcriptional regulator [Acidobacteriota bacterium]